MSSDRIEALSRSLADSTSRRNLLKGLGIGVAGTAVSVAGLNEALAKNNKNNGKGNGNSNGSAGATLENQLRNIPVRANGKKGTFKGSVDITAFQLNSAGNGIEAVGQLTGKVTGDAKKTGNGSKKTKNVNEQVVFPVTVTSGGDVVVAATCTILNLVLGPITLNLLGLTLTTNTIRIRLTGETNSLLGGLLCGLVGAPLINLGDLVAVVGLLNQILAILG
jgi:hypothetical protein